MDAPRALHHFICRGIERRKAFDDDAEQRRIVSEVEKLKKQIGNAQAVIDAAPARKEAVMKKYL